MKLTKNRRRINWLIALMTVSLLGITGIQAYWLIKTYRLEEEKFNQSVAEALLSVSRRLETLETIDFLYDNINLEPLFSSKANPLVGFEGRQDSALRIESAEGSYNIKMRFDDDSIQVYENKSESSPGLYYSNRDTTYRLALSDRQKLLGKFRKVDMVFNQMILHAFQRGSGGIERMTERHLDSVLDFELQSRGIKLPYEYSVIDDGEKVMVSRQWQEQLPSHRAALFPDDFFGHSTLLVNFPGKARYLLRSMWITLLVSLLFTSTIIFAFWRTVSYSLQQKRISDIKTDFINNMTHEFKTPIATISLAIDALRNPKVISNEDRIRHYSDVIRQENNRMNMQVESVLRMALMDKKELDLDLEPVMVHELLDECMEHIGLQLESKDGCLQKDYRSEEMELMLDRNHFSNTVINILDNAIKYSVGTPEIKLSTDQSQDHFILMISDKGIGMSKEEQKHIFDRFFRVAAGNIQNIRGHGLGLSYARGIVEAHGGSIAVESEKNRGSKFYVYLPLNSSNQV